LDGRKFSDRGDECQRRLEYFRKGKMLAVITAAIAQILQLAASETSTTCLILTGSISPASLILDGKGFRSTDSLGKFRYSQYRGNRRSGLREDSLTGTGKSRWYSRINGGTFSD
jgi:hypothetical protein